jgi:tetratricopeptide (TPR) repeat protein
MKFLVPFLLVSILVSCGNSSEGDTHFKAGEYEKAIEAYTRYLDGKQDKDAYYNRGRAYEELGDLQNAKADFDKAIELDPRHLQALKALAKISYNEKNFSSALLQLSDVIKLHPNDAEAHYLAARSKHHLGYGKEALESYDIAILLNKDLAEAYLYRGAVKRSLNMKTACDDFRIAHRMGVKGASGAVESYCQ